MKLGGRDLKQELMRIARFSLVGVINLAVDVSVFAILAWRMGMNLVLANLASIVAVVLSTFVLNRIFTFRAPFRTASATRGFAIFAAANAVLQTTILVLLANHATSVGIAKGVAIVVSASLNYLLLSRIVFDTRDADAKRAN